MNPYPITPYVGAGPLKLGMNQRDMTKIIGENPRLIRDMAYYVKTGIQAEFKANKAVFIQFSGPQLVTIGDYSPIGKTYGEAILDLEKRDPTTEDENPDITSYELGLTYYIDGGLVACAAIFVQGYYGQPGATKAANVPIVDERESKEYWKDYDALMGDVGHAFIADYMSKVDLSFENDPPGDGDVKRALAAHHDAFEQTLIGSADEPGVLMKLVLSGMAAGQAAIYSGSAANPQKPTAKKDSPIVIDWELLSKEAYDFARKYVYDLIKRIDDTTRTLVQKAVADWIASGEPLSALRAKLTEIFHDEARAQLIAQTESTRAYSAGAVERYRRADIKQVTWNTVRTADVCPICDALEAKGPQPIGSFEEPPAHPGCRCWLRPVVQAEDLA